ncbi:MAG TPA: hypothetical protein VMU39_27505 [Solirubrobacteraceae bacterium]|nr:hypothetical protein [Solirubrobacteraceae bacterium]
MAIATAPRQITAAKTLGLSAMPSLPVVEKTGMSWKKGAPLVDDGSTGRVIEVTSPIGTGSQVALIGFAEDDASGVAGRATRMVPCFPGAQIFEGNLKNSGAGTFHTLAEADIWQCVKIAKDATFSTGYWFLDANNASTTTMTVVNDGAMIVGFKDPVGTVDARVYFIVTAALRKPATGTGTLG